MKSRKKSKPQREYLKLHEELMRKRYKPEELYKEGYPETVGSLFHSNPDFKRKIEKETLGEISKKKVLEIGPGHSPLAEKVRDKTYLDVSKFFLEGLKGEKVLGKVENLPFKDKKFDTVLASDIFCNIRPQNRSKAINEMTRVSNEVWIFDYNELDEKGKFRKKIEHVGEKVPTFRYEIRPKKIKDILSKQGFHVEIATIKIPLEEGKRLNFFIIRAKRTKR